MIPQATGGSSRHYGAQFATDQGNTDTAQKILSWVESHTSGTGMLGEQLDPATGEYIAPLPLTWSHAEYISTLIDMIGKHSPLTEGQ